MQDASLLLSFLPTTRPPFSLPLPSTSAHCPLPVPPRLRHHNTQHTAIHLSIHSYTMPGLKRHQTSAANRPASRARTASVQPRDAGGSYTVDAGGSSYATRSGAVAREASMQLSEGGVPPALAMPGDNQELNEGDLPLRDQVNWTSMTLEERILMQPSLHCRSSSASRRSWAGSDAATMTQLIESSTSSRTASTQQSSTFL